MKAIGILGAEGKMGLEVVELLKEQKIKVFCFSRTGAHQLDVKNLSACQVVIDFSSPAGLGVLLTLAQKTKTPVVSGTTGISVLDEKKIKNAAKKIPVLWAPNMSLGIAVLKKTLESFSHLQEFDFQIEETHHHLKKDSPSGTAKALQKKLQQTLTKQQLKKLKEPISYRTGEVFGIHKVFAVSEHEILSFEHKALDRKVFAAGALKCAQWLAKKKPGLYSVESVLDV